MPEENHERALGCKQSFFPIEKGRPCGIGREGGRRNPALIDACEVNRPNAWPALFAACFTEKDKDAPIGRPCGSLIMKACGENALALSIGAHDSDMKAPFSQFGEGDLIPARRPYGCSVIAFSETDSVGILSIGVHDIDLLRSAAIGFKGDAPSIG